MPSESKVQFVDKMVDVFTKHDSLVVLRSEGFNMSGFTRLRFQLHAAGARLISSKNRLTKIAFARARRADAVDALNEFLSGPLSIAYSDDMVSLSQVLRKFVKDKKNTGLTVVCGVLKGEIFNKTDVESFASMPSLDDMRVSLLRTLQTNPCRMVSMLRVHQIRLSRVLNARLDRL